AGGRPRLPKKLKRCRQLEVSKGFQPRQRQKTSAVCLDFRPRMNQAPNAICEEHVNLAWLDQSSNFAGAPDWMFHCLARPVGPRPIVWVGALSFRAAFGKLRRV